MNPYDEPGNDHPTADVSRVLRGGAWFFDPMFCRAAYRVHFAPVNRDAHFGFRMCRGAPIERLRAAPLNIGTLKR